MVTPLLEKKGGFELLELPRFIRVRCVPMLGIFRKLRWQDISFMSAVVTFGLSQIFTNLLLSKPEAFSKSLLYVFWTILWIQAIPIIILILLDRLWPDEKSISHRIWRAVLCSILALSLLHQFRIFHNEYFLSFLSFLPIRLLYLVVGVSAFLIVFLSRKIVALFLSYLGIAGVVVPVILIWHSVTGFKLTDHERQEVKNNPSGIPIIILIFDELQYDVLVDGQKINTKYFPNFSALAADSIWFTNASTNHWSTVDSIPTLLTGKVNPSGKDLSLFEILDSSHSSTLMVTEIELENRLRKEGRLIDNYRGKSHFLSHNPFYAAEYSYLRLYNFFRFSNPKNSILDDPAYHVSLSGQIEELLIPANSKNVPLIICHISIPHSPFIYNHAGSKQSGSNTYFPFAEDYDPSEYDFIYNKYRGQVRFSDHVLGRFINGLKKAGVYNSSLLIVTSDHGLRIWGDLFRKADLVARIPLIMRLPGGNPEIYAEDFQLVDLAPTILDVLHIPYQKSMFEGVSFFESNRPTRDKIIHYFPSDMAFNYSKSGWFSTKKTTKDSKGLSANLASAFQSGAVSGKFSAVALMDDLFLSRESGRDFLKLYLHKHFPKSVTRSDLEELQSNLAVLQKAPDSPQINFRRGMLSLFLAIGETYMISKDEHTDIKKVNEYWRRSLLAFENSKNLSSALREEVTKLLKASDVDQDGVLNQQELKQMIKSRNF